MIFHPWYLLFIEFFVGHFKNNHTTFHFSSHQNWWVWPPTSLDISSYRNFRKKSKLGLWILKRLPKQAWTYFSSYDDLSNFVWLFCQFLNFYVKLIDIMRCDSIHFSANMHHTKKSMACNVIIIFKILCFLAFFLR